MCNECHDLHFYRQESHFPDSTIYIQIRCLENLAYANSKYKSSCTMFLSSLDCNLVSLLNGMKKLIWGRENAQLGLLVAPLTNLESRNRTQGILFPIKKVVIRNTIRKSLTVLELIDNSPTHKAQLALSKKLIRTQVW